MLNTIKTLNIYCKINLNEFFNKNIFGVDKKNLIYMVDFLCQILRLNILKMFKFQGFLQISGLVFQGFICLNCQILGFSGLPGKVATLILKF